MWFLTSARIVRFVLAPALSLWVAGVGCMLGCEGQVAAATKPGTDVGQHAEHNATVVGAGHACSLSRSHGCCGNGETKLKPESATNKTTETTLITARESSSGMMEGCPLAVSRAAVAAKSNSVEVKAALTIGPTFPAGGFFEQTIPLSTPPRLPNRSHTYLRCCVFLI